MKMTQDDKKAWHDCGSNLFTCSHLAYNSKNLLKNKNVSTLSHDEEGQ